MFHSLSNWPICAIYSIHKPPAPKPLGGKELSNSNVSSVVFCDLRGGLARGTMASVLVSVSFRNVLLPCLIGKLCSCTEEALAQSTPVLGSSPLSLADSPSPCVV